MKSSIATLSAQLDELMLRDQQRLQRQLYGVKKINKLSEQQASITIIEKAIITARQHVLNRMQVRPSISYPDNLPVSQKKQDIYNAIRDNQVVIVAGETGSGKTTQLPKICLELGRGIKGLIGHTQPRRLAARTVADRINAELESFDCVGYKVRFNDNVGSNTLIKLMTDGILLAEIQQDRLLMQYDTLIIDEAHERSLNIDFILGYLRELLPKRPDLKIIITSATIDHQRFSQHFNNAPIVEVSGRTYPVEVRYRPVIDDNSADRDELQAIFDAVNELGSEGPGDILIFMSGEREIRDTADALNSQNLPHTEVLPLYSRLSNSEQNRIFQSHHGRRIVLATNVAETSLTVPGIKYVIDPGYARISRYSFRTKVQCLPIEPVSQASANQRKGRCGRVSDGICIRLYSELDFLSRPEFTDPEILRTNLAAVILQMTALRLSDIKAFPFITAPDKRNIQDGVRVLEELGAIKIADNGHHHLTSLGHQLAQLPLDPRLARMVLAAQKNGCVREVMIITSALSIQEPRERPVDKLQASDEKHRRFADKDSDFLTFVNLWGYLKDQQAALSSVQFRKLCRRDFLNCLRVREWQDIYTQLCQVVNELGILVNVVPADYRSVHSALLTGLLSHVGQKDVDKHEFTAARNARFAIFPGSGLFKKPPKWVMVAEMIETSRLWGRIAARIEPEWIEPLAQHLIKHHYSEPHWEKTQGAVMARERVTLFGLPIIYARKVNYSTIDPLLCREFFIRHGLVEGDWQTNYAFFSANLELLTEVEELEHKSRRRDILVDDQILFDFYDKRIGCEVISARHFDVWWKDASQSVPDLFNFEKSMLIKNNANNISELDYPDYWYQSGVKLRLSYQFEPGTDADGVTVHIPLPVLNQIQEQGFDWQIPGIRRELVIALIKSLPKPIRRNFVPVPDYAQALLEKIIPQKTSLLDALEYELKRMTGVTVSREAWRWEQVADYLKMTFRVVDDKNHTLAEGKNLASLRLKLTQQVQDTLSAVVDDGFEQIDLHVWNFGTLPSRYEQQRTGYVVKAWPALVDEKDSVAIRLFETEQQQQHAMLQGTRRLLWLNIPSPIKYLHEKLPNKSKLALYFNPYGDILALIDDCIACGIDKIIAQYGGPVWQETDFVRLQARVRAELNDTVVEIAGLVERILTMLFNINKRLKGKIALSQAMALTDIKTQLTGLVYPGFVTSNGWKRLSDSLRYLQAVERRMEKLAVDPQRDRVHMLRVQQIQQAWQHWLDQLPPERIQDLQVQEVRWMIEELRVSFFAQQLGTPYPISDKRILAIFSQPLEKVN